MRASFRSFRPGPVALAALLLSEATGCARMLTPVDPPTMAFEHDVPKIAGHVEVCVKPELYKRRWNVKEHPYRIDLGKRAALSFEQMAKSAFSSAVAVYSDRCGEDGETPWIEARIVSANRDWDGVAGFAEQEPVDTALTMSFTLRADDGSEIWTTTVKSEHRSVDSIPLTHGMRRQRGARDFGIVLGKALDEGYDQLLRSEMVRAAFGDSGLERPPAPDPEAENEG